jgi:hypothetical protein
MLKLISDQKARIGQGTFTHFADASSEEGASGQIKQAFNAHWSKLTLSASQEIAKMKSADELRTKIAGWSLEKLWVTESLVAAAMVKLRPPEHNVALLEMAGEQQQGKVQQAVFEEEDARAGQPAHVHHTPEKVGLKHVTGPGSIFGFQGDVSKTEYPELLAFA